MADADLTWSADHSQPAAKYNYRINRSGTVVRETVEYRSGYAARICRESSLTKGSRTILLKWSASMLAGLLPVRTGAGRARNTGQGASPLRVLRAAP